MELDEEEKKRKKTVKLNTKRPMRYTIFLFYGTERMNKLENEETSFVFFVML